MRLASFARVGLFALVSSSLSFGAAVVTAQAPTGTPASTNPTGYTPPRTPDGQPDLQGVWDYRTVTPLERPDEFAGKAFLTEEEVREYERRQAEVRNRDRRDGPAQADVQRAYNHFWWDFGTEVAGNQTSLIVDPPDGKIPPLTPAGRERLESRRRFFTASAREEGSPGSGFSSYTDRPLAERCLLWGVAGPPMMPGAYNNNVQILQSGDFVAIVNEMIHEHRMVPLDGRPHIPSPVRQWMGDSRGRWEGNTLVVETTNFTDKTSFRGASDSMRLIERFTRVGPDQLVYEFTVHDPETFTRPWTARIPMRKNSEPIYEYACHEGNYALTHALEGARNLEKGDSAGTTR